MGKLPHHICVLTAPVWLSIGHSHTVLCVLTVPIQVGPHGHAKVCVLMGPWTGYAEIGVLLVHCSDLSPWPQSPPTQGCAVKPKLSSHLVGHH